MNCPFTLQRELIIEYLIVNQVLLGPLLFLPPTTGNLVTVTV